MARSARKQRKAHNRAKHRARRNPTYSARPKFADKKTRIAYLYDRRRKILRYINSHFPDPEFDVTTKAQAKDYDEVMADWQDNTDELSGLGETVFDEGT